MEEFIYHSQFKEEEHFWWFIVRNSIVLDCITKVTDLKEGSDFLDAGCGTGAFAKMIASKYNLIGLDTSEIALDYCRKRGLTNLYNCTLQDFPADQWNIKALTMLDVIEHIKEDQEVVNHAFNILPRDGYFITTVPAYQWLWSQHDVWHMHYRRYNMNNFTNLHIKAGFKIVYKTYFNSFLLIPAILKRYIDNIRKSKSVGVDNLSNTPTILNSFFKSIFGIEKYLLPKINFPFGLSILVISKKISD